MFMGTPFNKWPPGQFKTTLPAGSCLETCKVYVEITNHVESSTVDQFEDNYTTHCFFFFFLFLFVFCLFFSGTNSCTDKFFCLIQT